MWYKEDAMPINKFIPYLVKTKPDELQGMRFVYKRDNIIYVAGFDTFSDVMPDGLNNKHEIEIWKWED